MKAPEPVTAPEPVAAPEPEKTAEPEQGTEPEKVPPMSGPAPAVPAGRAEPKARAAIVPVPPHRAAAAGSAVEQLVADLWPRLVADPGNAPRVLAEAAVRTLGPRAAAWAAHARATYPAATPRALARLATAELTRSAQRRGLFSALAGTYAPFAVVATAALTHADLVLRVAAAYGLDPTDPERVAEILALLPDYRGGAAWTALRLADRVLPGASLLGAVLGGRNVAAAVATRAERRYGRYRSQSNQESGSSS
ncbi:hypothetical protein [Actinoplanes teichomyceticus]|uniref:hypothetical protein n=1 Tax=Actinoplanes teichomyceticus TaxID=1867 RepID=UPI00119FC2C3|nr:hypothetical protein [Actinoplanes teichomyceticus]